MLQVIALTFIILNSYTYKLTIFLPYAYNIYQVGQEEDRGWQATIDGEGDMDKRQIWIFPPCCQPLLEARQECKH